MTCGFKGCLQPLRATGEKNVGWCVSHGDRYLGTPMGFPERRKPDHAGMWTERKNGSNGPSRKESGRL